MSGWVENEVWQIPPVGMRPIVRATLSAIWTKQGGLDAGAVFVNKLGKPYADTRQTGGNPLTSAHRRAQLAYEVFEEGAYRD